MNKEKFPQMNITNCTLECCNFNYNCCHTDKCCEDNCCENNCCEDKCCQMCSEETPQFLTAFSLAPQPVTSGKPLVFDKNSLSNGVAVTHENNSSKIVIEKTGFYNVLFHSTVAPTKSNSFPVSILLSLKQNSETVNGAGARNNFSSSSEAENMAFTQTIEVKTVPTTLEVIVDGGAIIYSDTSITVDRLGDIE